MRKPTLLLVLSALLLATGVASACNIPVFRYALERWRAVRDEDFYRLVVFHRGSLTADQQALIKQLRRFHAGELPTANVTVELVEVSEITDPAHRLWRQAHRDRPLPWIVLRYPNSLPAMPSAWAGPLDEKSVRLLIESPVRQELARRILHGESAVWIFLESGDSKQDESAARLLEAELARLKKTVQLPEDVGQGPVELLSDLPVRVDFSLIRLRRDDPAEQALIGMLLNSEADLRTFQEPMAFAVFGRGRVMPALVGGGITAKEIARVSEFVCGACSCAVKRLNPGFDLLMAVAWDERLQTAAVEEPVPESREGESVPIPSGKLPVVQSPPEVIPEKSPSIWDWAWPYGVILGVLVAVSAAVVIIRWERRGTIS